MGDEDGLRQGGRLPPLCNRLVALANPFIGGTIGAPSTATITVLGKDAMANPESFTGTFSLGNGQNFFTVVASNGEIIRQYQPVGHQRLWLQ